MNFLLKRNLFLVILINLFLTNYNAYADDAPIFSKQPSVNNQLATNNPAPNESTIQPPQPSSPALTGERETVIKENLTHLGSSGGLSVDKIPPVYSTDKASSN